LNREECPLAFDLLTNDIYVDDIAGGTDSDKEREEQIRQTEHVLSTGGLALKFVARSGCAPPEGATNDGHTFGCLGLTWDTEKDVLSPGIASMNLQKKIRGQKAAPERDVTTAHGLRSAMKDDLITRAGVLSRISEFFDPTGWWEPLRLQLKLSFQEMNSLDWKTPIPEELHEVWIGHFLTLERVKELTIPRCIIPESAPSNWKIRLICKADAAEGAGGVAIYGGIRLPDGNYTCDLLMAKSRLLKHSVPRNELEAILLMADTVLVVRNALGDRVEEVLYYTDSKVAQCWVLNTRKRLRMFVHNRVQSIRHAITRAVGSEEVIPLYHIDGSLNLADMLTKPKRLTLSDISATSSWMQGLDWMRLPTEDLPRSQYSTPDNTEEDLIVLTETFPDVEIYTIEVEAREALAVCTSSEESSTFLFSAPAVARRGSDLWIENTFDFLHLGWRRARKRLATVWKVALMFRHNTHRNNPQPRLDCCVCTNRLAQESDAKALFSVIRAASVQAEALLGKTKLLKKCTLQDDIWYSSQRLEREGLLETADLDFSAFYDGGSIKKMLPVVLSSSSFFQALVLYTHFEEFPHQGVESTLARIKASSSLKLY
jgi:hypothetical protein